MNRSHPPTTVAAILAAARARLADPREAAILVAHALGLTREALYAHPELAVSPVAAARARALVARRAAGEPVAYLTGRREFYGLALTVNPAVLIPRPETELLVELALAHLENTFPLPPRGDAAAIQVTPPLPPWGERVGVRGVTRTAWASSPSSRPRIESGAGSSPPRGEGALVETPSAPVIADVGTGSGAIALAIAHHRPDVRIIATDRSQAALAVAAANACALGLADVAFAQADWLAAFATRSFDLVVCNPPYVAERDPHLGEGDLRFEPPEALASGSNGLDAIRLLIREAATRLKPDGVLILEHGADQQPAICLLLAEHGYTGIETHRDLADLPRAVAACKSSEKLAQ